MSYSTVLYSENLLRLAAIRYFVLSPSVLYWQRMRPMAFSQQSSRDTSLILVVHDLRELFAVLSDYPSEKQSAIYVSSIGRLWESATSVSFQLTTILKSREIYCLLLTHPIIPLLKDIAQYFEGKDMFYFTFPVSFRNREFSSNFMGCMSKFSIEVREEFVVLPPIFPLRRVETLLYLNTPQGLVEWHLDHPIRRWYVLQYFQNYGRPGWQLLLTGQDPKSFKAIDFIGSTSIERDAIAFMDVQIKNCIPVNDLHPLLWKVGDNTIGTLCRQCYGRKQYKKKILSFSELPGLPYLRDTG